MRYQVEAFKSLLIALKEIEPFIRNAEHLQSGKAFKKFGGMRSREVLANWLLCVAVGAVYGRELTFTSDPVGGDGIIRDAATGDAWPTEHVMVPRLHAEEGGDAQALILKAIEQKQRKGGAPYAGGKTLVVFMEAGPKAGVWFPNKVTLDIPQPLLFAAVWLVGLHEVVAGEYVYNVVCLDTSDGNAPFLRVHVAATFDAWEVTRVQ